MNAMTPEQARETAHRLIVEVGPSGDHTYDVHLESAITAALLAAREEALAEAAKAVMDDGITFMAARGMLAKSKRKQDAAAWAHECCVSQRDGAIAAIRALQARPASRPQE